MPSHKNHNSSPRFIENGLAAHRIVISSHKCPRHRDHRERDLPLHLWISPPPPPPLMEAEQFRWHSWQRCREALDFHYTIDSHTILADFTVLLHHRVAGKKIVFVESFVLFILHYFEVLFYIRFCLFSFWMLTEG